MLVFFFAVKFLFAFWFVDVMKSSTDWIEFGISGLDLKCNTAGQEGHWSQLPIPALKNKAAFLQGPKQM